MKADGMCNVFSHWLRIRSVTDRNRAHLYLQQADSETNEEAHNPDNNRNNNGRRGFLFDDRRLTGCLSLTGCLTGCLIGRWGWSSGWNKICGKIEDWVHTPWYYCNFPAPTNPLGFEPGLIAHSTQRSNQLVQVRPASERLAGMWGCRIVIVLP